MITSYTCTLAADGFSDLVVPISSFQMRLRQSPSQCYLSVVVPSILDYADDITDREDGTVTVAQVVDGASTVLLTANLQDIRTDQGARNRSGTLVAYKQITFPGTGSVSLTKASYRNSNNGKRRYRCRPNAALKPADEAVINEETFDVDEVVWSISINNRVMELVEDLS